PHSGAMEFDSMGSSWVTVRGAVAAGTLRPGDKAAAEVAARWDQLISYAGLRLGRRLGVEVHPVLTRKQIADPALRATTIVAELANTGTLEGTLRIPDTIAPVTISADLRAGRLTAWLDVDAPRTGRPATRINWLTRQLKDAPDNTRIDCYTLHGRGASTSELLAAVRANPAVLLIDPARELRSFRIAITAPAGTKQGQGRGSFVGSVLEL